MDILEALQDVGLPGWVVIIAALLFALRQFGLLQWLTERITDTQEHAQGRQDKQAEFERLQASWQSDRIATILEENESFIRERVWGKLDKIDKAIEERLYRLEMTLAQLRDTLAVTGREIYELKRVVTRLKSDPASSQENNGD